MSYKQFLFGFDGRINRNKLWLAMLIALGSALVSGMLLIMVMRIFGSNDSRLSFSVHGEDVFRLVDPAFYRLAIDRFREGDLTTAALLPLLFRAIVTLVVVWCCAAALIKRLHDRNKNGWWTLPFVAIPGIFHQFEDRLGDSNVTALAGLVMTVLGLWCLIEVVCLKGTTGPNRFGRDPLAPVDTRPGWDQNSELEFVPHAAGPSPGPHVMREHE